MPSPLPLLSSLPQRPLPSKTTPSVPIRTDKHTDAFGRVVDDIEDGYARKRVAVRSERKIRQLGHYPPETLKVLKKHGIEKFQGVIIPYLKRSGEITLQDERFIQTTVERMIRRGELVRSDKNDLKHILKALGSSRRV